MGLVRMQEILARLYTDASFRGDFFADPSGQGEALGLGEEETRQLATLSPAQVDFFALQLHRKRLGEVRHLLPFTFKALKDQFNYLFFRYADSYLPSGIKKHQEDAISFAGFLQRYAEAESIEPTWAIEIARYEATWLEAVIAAQCILLRVFRCDVSRAIWNLRTEGPIPELSRGPSIGVWVRLHRSARVRHAMICLRF